MRYFGFILFTLTALNFSGPAKAGNLADELAELDLYFLANQFSPDWAVPKTMQESSGAVVFEQRIERMESGHDLYGLYVFAQDRWHLFGIRAVLPGHDVEEVGGVHYLGKGRYEGRTLERLGVENPDTPGLLSSSSCNDDPDSHTPSPFGVEPGTTADFSWTGYGSDGGACDYQVTYEFQGGDYSDWITIAFEWEYEPPPQDDDDDEHDDMPQ